MPIIVEANESYADLYASVTGAGTLVVRDLEALRKTLEDKPNEYAVILGAGVNMDAALLLADSMRVTRPSLSVLLIRRRVDTSVLTDALRAGMREVVEERDLTGLGTAVTRARELWEAINETTAEVHAKNGKLFTIFSPKGGVGKTTMSTNIAIALAQREGASVCLVDLDLAFGDVAITLQLVPGRTIEDALQLQSGGLDFEVLETLLTPHPSGLKTLAAPIQPDVKDNISAHLVGNILRLLKANFDYVIVDSAPALDEHVLQAIDQTDELVLVTTLDVPTLKNVKVAIETLELLNFPVDRRHLVLNRADDKVGLKTEDVEATLGMKIAAAVPVSPSVAQATNSGDPIVSADPRHAASRAFKAFAQRLIEARGGEPAGHAPASTAVLPPPPAPKVDKTDKADKSETTDKGEKADKADKANTGDQPEADPSAPTATPATDSAPAWGTSSVAAPARADTDVDHLEDEDVSEPPKKRGFFRRSRKG